MQCSEIMEQQKESESDSSSSEDNASSFFNPSNEEKEKSSEKSSAQDSNKNEVQPLKWNERINELISKEWSDLDYGSKADEEEKQGGLMRLKSKKFGVKESNQCSLQLKPVINLDEGKCKDPAP